MIKAIMAVDKKFGVGRNGTLPWPANKEDLRYFKECTSGHIVVMGSKTWKDPCFPAPLKNRDNYVVSNMSFMGEYPGCTGIINGDIVNQIKDIEKIAGDKIVWIIGGPTIIEQCMDIIDEFYLTKIPGDYNCDVFLKFPDDKFSLKSIKKKENTYLIYN